MSSKYSTFNPTPYETHMLVYEKIQPKSEVLDIGCASGYFAKKLKKKNCRVWGIDSDREALNEASRFCDEVKTVNLENIKEIPFKRKFDYILLLDVLEHLKNPNNIMTAAKNSLKPTGRIIISTPNIAFLSIRLALLFGKFNYQKMGIMDENHLHFFTKKTLMKLISDSGLKLEEFDVASGFSQITRIGKYLNYIPKYWQYRITKRFDALLGYQLIAVCAK